MKPASGSGLQTPRRSHQIVSRQLGKVRKVSLNLMLRYGSLVRSRGDSALPTSAESGVRCLL